MRSWEHINFILNLGILNDNGEYSLNQYSTKLECWVELTQYPRVNTLTKAWEIYNKEKKKRLYTLRAINKINT